MVLARTYVRASRYSQFDRWLHMDELYGKTTATFLPSPSLFPFPLSSSHQPTRWAFTLLRELSMARRLPPVGTSSGCHVGKKPSVLGITTAGIHDPPRSSCSSLLRYSCFTTLTEDPCYFLGVELVGSHVSMPSLSHLGPQIENNSYQMRHSHKMRTTRTPFFLTPTTCLTPPQQDDSTPHNEKLC